MNAKEMFESLGYTLIRSDNCLISYEKNKIDALIRIAFIMKDKKFYSEYNDVAHDITMDELKAISQQLKELHWLDEKAEIKEVRNPEVTNFEYYKDEILENCLVSLAVVKGRPKLCFKTNCNDCDFKINQIGCHNKVKEWLKQTHIKQKYKVTKFEYDLLQSFLKGHPLRYQFKNINALTGMKEKGYFKGVDEDEMIEDILANCEVIK